MIIAIAFLVFALGCTIQAFRRHPVYAFYFYLATIYVFPQGRWWGQVFGGTRWALIAAGVTFLAVALHRGRLRSKPSWIQNTPAVVMVVYAAWMWIQTPWAVDLDSHLSGSVQFTKYILAFWFVYRIVDTPARARDVLFAHMTGCLILGLLAYAEGRAGDRLDGVGGPGLDDANTLGMYLATGCLVALAMVITQTGWRRWFSVLAGAIILNGLVLTNTRGAFLGLVAAGGVMAVFKSRQHSKVFWGLALLGLMAAAVIVDKSFIERMATISESTVDSEDVDQSARSRIVVARAQLEMFLDYPLGSGHRGTPALSARYLDERWLTRAQSTDDSAARASHNTFLTTLVEQGVPGAILYLWLFLWTAGAMLQLRLSTLRRGDPGMLTQQAAVIAVMAVVFVAGNTADFLLAEVQFWMFATLVSLRQFALAEIEAAAAVRPQRPVVPAGATSVAARG